MSSPPPTPSTDVLAAAAERRTAALKRTSHLTETYQLEKRQHFRRLIDPGIMRPNTDQVAMESLKVLLKIAENLLREPNNPKFQRFKTTNSLIKRHLVDPKGTLEYAIELGFQPKVENFQPFYVFNPSRLSDLSIGAEIIKEKVELETEKQERTLRSKKEEKAAAEAVANNVKLAFMDDRKTKLTRDEREKERREARAAATATLPPVQLPSPTIQGSGYVLATGALQGDQDQDDHEMSSPASSPPPTSRRMPGSGHLLVTADHSTTDIPPPYGESSE